MIAKQNLVFLGPPGAGKGTLAGILSNEHGIVHISTGDIFRSEIAKESELGKKAKHYVTSGGLVPDELVAEMVGARLSEKDCDSGFILDGFPRTVVQAELLEKTLSKIGKSLDAVVYFKAGEELLLKRLTARFMCEKCNAVYNKLFSPTKKDGVCDQCQGTKFYQRPDDTLETAKDRLRVYNEQTAPLIDHYQKEGLLRDIDAEKQRQETYPELLAVLN